MKSPQSHGALGKKASGSRERPYRRVLTDDQVTEAARLYKAKKTLPQLASRYGVGAETVRRALLRRGVRMRQRGGFKFYGHGTRVWVDPIWGRLAYLMYREKPARAKSERSEGRPAVVIDLGSPPE